MPIFLLAIGLYLVPIGIIGIDFSKIPGDLGDARFNNYVLEHGFNYVTGKVESFWDAKFMYPQKNVIALSDNLLGTLPVYSIFRLTGFDRETSFQFWLLTLFALNYIFCFMMLKSWFGNIILAATGAYIYAFSIFTIGHLGHVQSFPRFIAPFALFWLFKYLQTKNIKFFTLCSAAIILQLYCGLYLGIFTISTILFLLIAYMVVFRDISVFSQFKHIKKLSNHFLIIIASLLTLFPLIQHYLITSNEHGYFAFEEVQSYIPTLQSYVFASYASVTWKILSQHGVENLYMFWNQYLFPGGVAFLGILISPLVLINRYIDKPRKKLLLFLMLGLLLSIIFHLKVGNFTLYEVIYNLPGFGSIRSVDRVINIQILLFIFPTILVFTELGKIYNVVKYLILLLPLLVICDNLINPELIKRFSKTESQNRTKDLKNLIMDKIGSNHNILAYLHNKPDYEEKYKIHLDAMIASQDMNIASVNAYTGLFPGPFVDFYDNMDYESLMKWYRSKYLELNETLVINNFGHYELTRSIVYFKCSNGKYLSTESDHRIISDKNHHSLWEEFTLIKEDDHLYVIKTYNNNYFGLDNENRIIFKSTIDNKNQRFQIIESGNDTIVIKATNKKYLELNISDGFLYATADSINKYSKFVKSIVKP